VLWAENVLLRPYRSQAIREKGAENVEKGKNLDFAYGTLNFNIIYLQNVNS